MTEAIFAKLVAPLWDILKYVWAALIGLLIWIWRRQDAEIKRLQNEVSEMRQNVVYKGDLDEQADRIREEVKEEHGKIIDTMKEIQAMMRTDLHNCNHSLMDEVRQIRGFLMEHVERRSKTRD